MVLEVRVFIDGVVWFILKYSRDLARDAGPNRNSLWHYHNGFTLRPNKAPMKSASPQVLKTPASHLKQDQRRIARYRAFPILVVRSNIRHIVSEHSHEFYEIECVEGGQGENHSSGIPERVKAGDIFLGTPFHSHSVYPQPSLKMLSLKFDPGVLGVTHYGNVTTLSAFFTNETFRRRVPLGQTDKQEVKKLLAAIFDECALAKPFWKERAKALLQALLLLLSRAALATAPLFKDLPLALRILEWIREHHPEDIGMADLKKTFGLSAPWLNRMLKRAHGKSFVEVLLHQRLLSARHFLVEGGKSVSQAAHDAGFGDLSHFHRSYKKVFGSSPAGDRER